jgi:putative hydrolase of the HAD superfamily
MNLTHYQVLLFDWGDTLMKDDPSQPAAMVDWPEVEKVAGADLLLEKLHHSGRILALATGAAVSNEAQIRGALARVGLDRYFDKVYCFANTGQRKPAEAFYRFILDDLQAQPEEALMIGDSFEKDVLAANRAGLAAVWFNPTTPEKRDGAGFTTVHSLPELLTLFQEVS